MKLLDFSIEEDLLVANQAELSDTVRLMLYEDNPALLEQLDYSDDESFLDPALFYYFLADEASKKNAPLAQTLYGYLPVANRPALQPVRADEAGLVFLPKLGYFNAAPNTQLNLHWEAATQTLAVSGSTGGPVPLLLEPEFYLPNSPIRLARHATDLLTNHLHTELREPVQASVGRNRAQLLETVDLLQRHLPDFWHLLGLTNREVVLFNSPNQMSMAIISYHGTAFLNVLEGPNTPVFFLDDLAHQGGHVIFNSLTLQTEDFLRVSKHASLNEYTHVARDERTVYGAFHGLFTYTSILHCLDYCLQHKVLTGGYKQEALARLGFYTRKFRLDANTFPATTVLTAAGMRYWEMFVSGLEGLEQRYKSYLAEASYQNQPYIFDYALFQAVNDHLPVVC